MPAPFGPTIPIRSPRWAARNGIRATTTGSPARGRRAGVAAPGEVADGQVLGADHDLARAGRAGPGQRRVASLSLLVALGASIRSAWSRSSRASCSCIFENLRWLR